MDVSKFDYVEYKKYEGIDDGGLKAISDCITCDYPSLRHFNMPKPKNQEVHSGILAPIRQGPSPTAAPTTSPSLRASSSPSRISSNPPTLETASPTNGPTKNPTNGPTNNPTNGPTNSPTDGPTKSPTNSPTNGPTNSPTDGPTNGPTNGPTKSPTAEPTVAETLDPTNSPTLATTNSPTAVSTTQSPTTSSANIGGSPSGANSPSSSSETSPSTDSNTGGNSPASSPTAGNPSSPSETSPSTDPNTGGNSPVSSPTAGSPSSPSETSPSTDSNTGGNSPASSPTADNPSNPSATSPSDSNTAGNEPASSPTAGNPSNPSATSPSDSNTAGNEPASSPTAGNPSSPSGPNSPSVASPSTDPDTDPDTDPVVCISNSRGDFFIGSLESGTQHYIDYKYRLETIKGKASITEEILPVMEKNLLDAILPSVFRDSCINSRRVMELDTHNRRSLSMIGASAKPDDTISTDGVCGSENTKLDCNIIDGRMTMMSDSEPFNSTEFDNLICDVLNDGSLEIGHPAVKHISCIPMKVGTILDIDDTTSDKSKTPTIEPVTESLNSISYLVSFAAAAFVILGIYGYRRRHLKKDEVDHLDDSDLVNMEQSLSFENGLGSTAMDFTPIVNPSFSAGGIEVLARNSYFPETIEESEDEDDEHLDEVSLDDLNMTTTSEYYNNSWRNDSS